jgi:hypothetical protein
MPTYENLKKSVDNYKGNLKKLVIMLSDIGGIINPDIRIIAKFCKKKILFYLKTQHIVLDRL